jgi:thiamine-phosphate diphosphorylase
VTPIIALVTDRRRLGADWPDALPALARRAARAGVDLVQVREADLDGAALLALVMRTVAAVAGTRARVVVNGRADVALAAGAHGVHLPSTGPPACRIRALAPPGWLVGRSVHSAAEAARAGAAGAVDYLLLGTVFATASKPGLAPCGASELARAVAATAVPVLAIGGVALARMTEVAGAGAAGVAAISLFTEPGADPAGLVAETRRMFDTPTGLS